MKLRTRIKRLRRKLTIQNMLSLGIGVFAAILLLLRLGSLHTGLAASEAQLPPVQQLLQTIWNEPLLLPYTLSQLATAVILPSAGYTASRLPSVLLAALTLLLMYWVFVQWYGRRLAVFGIILLMSAASFLHVARIATPAIVYPFCMALLLVLAAWWHKNSRPQWLIYASVIASVLLLYVPGMIWLLLGLIIVERKHIAASFLVKFKHIAFASLLGVITLVPLARYLASDWQRYQQLLAIDGSIAITDFLKGTVDTWQYFFIGGYESALYNVAALPLLSIFTMLCFFVGIHLYSKHPTAVRTRLLMFWALAGTALIALPSSIHISLLLPIIFTLAIGGIGYLLHLWLKVFPRNPFARGFGIGLIGLVLVCTVIYNTTSYFIAWPYNDRVQATFSKRL